MKKTTLITILAILLLVVIGAYWYFFVTSGSDAIETPSGQQSGFSPFGRPSTGTGTPGGTVTNNSGSTTTPNTQGTKTKIPTLRLLSNTPVGGYGASTTETVITKATKLASSTQTLGTTHIRWVDRGRGNVYEAKGNTQDIATLSNTVVPKIFESVWDKNLTSFTAFSISEQNNSISAVLAELKTRSIAKTSTSTSTTSPQTNNTSSITPYELKGKKLPDNIIAYAVSPKKDRIFIMVNESGTGIGYVSNFNGTSPTQIFTTPLTQINAEWPSDNVIAITTKGSATERGFLYFVDPKTGVWNKILGPLPGLSTKVSTDAKYVFVSVAGNADNIITSIYNVSTRTGTDGIIRTLADKCIWGNFYKDIVYCAVPSQPVKATYPDDWYKGTISLIDKIWQVNATTGEIKLISSIVDTSDRVIDAFNLGLDPKDNFLIFMNKNDLSLWSLDLVSGD
jgi:hypothetical protein